MITTLLDKSSSETIYTTCGNDQRKRKERYIDPILKLLANVSENNPNKKIEIISSDNNTIIFNSINGTSTINIY
jgi:hypothetical protein